MRGSTAFAPLTAFAAQNVTLKGRARTLVGTPPAIRSSPWNAVETNGCVDGPLPEIALSLVRYLQHMHIGLIGWAIDSEPGTLVKDHIHFEPTNYDDCQGCSGKNGPSLSGAGRLLAAFPNN